MRNYVKICAAVLALSVLAGCVAAGRLTVSTDGSTSMEKVVGTLGEVFEGINPEMSFTYNPTGSGTGIQAVIDGRCDIGLSSRRLKASEEEQGLSATLLAYDGIAVIVNKDNVLEDLSLEDIVAIYTGEVTNWSGVGGSDEPIVVIGREAGSGTRDGFESVTETSGLCRYRQELTSSGDVITTVASNTSAIGYTSLASVRDTVRVVTVDGVEPDEESIRDGSYALQRPFLLVTRTDGTMSAAAREFLDFATSDAAAPFISGAGCVAPMQGQVGGGSNGDE
jgi:phosphate transport system substrate-binding protein